MKWLTNMADPRKTESDTKIALFIGESVADAVKYRNKYLQGKVIGRPEPTPMFTVEQLEKEGIVGIYSENDDED